MPGLTNAVHLIPFECCLTSLWARVDAYKANLEHSVTILLALTLMHDSFFSFTGLRCDWVKKDYFCCWLLMFQGHHLWQRNGVMSITQAQESECWCFDCFLGAYFNIQVCHWLMGRQHVDSLSWSETAYSRSSRFCYWVSSLWLCLPSLRHLRLV